MKGFSVSLWEPTVNSSRLGLSIEPTHSYQELITDKEPRKNPLGFCMNKKCKPWKSMQQSSKAYRLSTHKSFVSQFVTSDHAQSICPHCKYALFWSRHYHEIGFNKDFEEQEKARRLSQGKEL